MNCGTHDKGVVTLSQRDAAWQACFASALASELERLDRVVLGYPIELRVTWELRRSIARALRELAEHAECIEP